MNVSDRENCGLKLITFLSSIVIACPHSNKTLNPKRKYNVSIISNWTLLWALILTSALLNEPLFSCFILAEIIPIIGLIPNSVPPIP